MKFFMEAHDNYDYSQMFIVMTTYGHYASSYSGAAGRRSLGRETERRRGRREKSKL